MLDIDGEARNGDRVSPTARVRWPADAVGQITALRSLAAATPISVEEAARRFAGAPRHRGSTP